MKKVISTVLIFLMFCLSYVVVMGAEESVVSEHPVSEVSESDHRATVVKPDPLPNHPPAIPKAPSQAVPDHEVMTDTRGVSLGKSSDTSLDKGFSHKMKMLRDQQAASLQTKQQELDDLHAQREEVEKPVVVRDGKGLVEKAQRVKEKASKVINRSKDLKVIDEALADHEKAVVTTKAKHQKDLQSVLQTHLDHDLSLLQKVDKVHANLGLTSAPQTEQEVEEAFQRQSDIVTTAWDDLQQVTKDPAYKDFLSRVQRAAVDIPIVELGANPKFGMKKGFKIGGDLHELYGKESDYVFHLRVALAAARDKMLAAIRNKSAKNQQLNDLLSTKNPYKTLGGEFGVGKSSEPSMSFDWFTRDVKNAHDQQVERIKKGSYVLGDNQKVKDAVAHVAKARDTLLDFHKRLQEVRVSDVDNWKQLGLPQDLFSLDDINEAYELKKKKIDQLKADMDRASVPASSGLHKEIEKEKALLDKAHANLVDRAKKRLATMKDFVGSADTVANSKKLLGLNRVTSVQVVEQAYDRATQAVRGAGDELDIGQESMLDRLKQAKDLLLKRLQDPYQITSQGSMKKENYEVVGLDEPTYSIEKVKRAAAQKLQELKDHKELIEDGGWVEKSKPDQEIYTKKMRNIDAEQRAVERSRDFLIHKMTERIKTIQSEASQQTEAASRRLLGDIGAPATEQTIEQAYQRTLQEIDGASTIIDPQKIGVLKARAEKAQEQLIDSLAPPKGVQEPEETEDQRRQRLQSVIPHPVETVLTPDEQDVLVDFVATYQPSAQVARNPQAAEAFARNVVDGLHRSNEMIDLLDQPGVLEGFEDEWNSSSLQAGIKKPISGAVSEEKMRIREKVEIGVGWGIWVAGISGLIAWIIEENR